MLIEKYVIVVGASPQGLFLVRLLARAGFKVINIVSRESFSWYSRYGKKILVSNKNEFYLALREQFDKYGEIPCYLTSGPEIFCLIHEYPDIFDLFEMHPRPIEAVKLFSSKLETYEVAESIGMTCPESFTGQDVVEKKSSKKIIYPCIVKWNVECNLFVKTSFKTQICSSEDNLLGFLSGFSENSLSHIIVQEFIDSAQSNNVSFFGYFSDGKCRLGLLAQQLGQYPQGITSYLREYDGPLASVIELQAKQLIKQVGFNGFAEVEFKITDNCKKAYLLEVNPRPCGWSSALKGKYKGMHDFIAEGFVGVAAEKKRVEWVNIGRHFLCTWSTFLVKKSLRKLFVDLWVVFGLKTYDILDLRDPLPFIMQFITSVRQKK